MRTILRHQHKAATRAERYTPLRFVTAVARLGRICWCIPTGCAFIHLFSNLALCVCRGAIDWELATGLTSLLNVLLGSAEVAPLNLQLYRLRQSIHEPKHDRKKLGRIGDAMRVHVYCAHGFVEWSRYGLLALCVPLPAIDREEQRDQVGVDDSVGGSSPSPSLPSWCIVDHLLHGHNPTPVKVKSRMYSVISCTVWHLQFVCVVISACV